MAEEPEIAIDTIFPDVQNSTGAISSMALFSCVCSCDNRAVYLLVSQGQGAGGTTRSSFSIRQTLARNRSLLFSLKNCSIYVIGPINIIHGHEAHSTNKRRRGGKLVHL